MASSGGGEAVPQAQEAGSRSDAALFEKDVPKNMNIVVYPRKKRHPEMGCRFYASL